jgi:hypothetical protein
MEARNADSRNELLELQKEEEHRPFQWRLNGGRTNSFQPDEEEMTTGGYEDGGGASQGCSGCSRMLALERSSRGAGPDDAGKQALFTPRTFHTLTPSVSH